MKKLTRKVETLLRGISIRQRLLSLGLIVLAVACACLFYLTLRSVQVTRATIRNSNSTVVTVISINLDDWLRDLYIATKMPILQAPDRTEIYNFLTANQGDITRSSSEDRYTYFYNAYKECYALMEMNSRVSTIDITDLKGNYLRTLSTEDHDMVYKEISGNYYYMHSYVMGKMNLDKTWTERVMKLRGRMYCLPKDLIEGTDHFIKQDTSFYAARAIVNSDTVRPIGMILIRCDVEPLLDYFKDKRTFSSQKLSVFNREGELLFGDSDAEYTSELSRALSFGDDNKKTSARSQKLNIGGRRYLCDYTVTAEGYTAAVLTPYDVYVEYIIRQERAFFIFMCLVLAGLAVCFSSIVNSIRNPLRHLEAACKEVEKGNFSITLDDEGKDELTHFSKSFETMTSEIQLLIQEKYEQKLQYNHLEIQMLRAQINPHFLYNTLESISAGAYLKGEKELAYMAVLLGRSLRYSISQPDDTVTVRQELDELHDYMELQKIRYKEQLNFCVSIEEELYDHRILKLLLQPLIENAVYHGISMQTQNGSIELLGYVKNEKIIFKVIDNGPGIEEPYLTDLNDYIQGKNEKFKTIGLRNVNRRIQLFYGSQYDVHIESSPPFGTSVIVVIPARAYASSLAAGGLAPFAERKM